MSGPNNISTIGNSNKKKDSLLLSMKLHIQYLRSVEESERVRKACLNYLQTWYGVFYPERSDLVAEIQLLAADLKGSLQEPRLRWKYAWMKPLFGYGEPLNGLNRHSRNWEGVVHQKVRQGDVPNGSTPSGNKRSGWFVLIGCGRRNKRRKY